MLTNKFGFLRALFGTLVWMLTCIVSMNEAFAQADGPPVLRLRVQVADRALAMNELGQLTDRQGRALAIARLDLLVSQFSLQRADQSWTTVQNWHGFYRAEQPGRSQPLPHIPPGDYVAARFSVGVEPGLNHADPHKLPPDHPLHPVVNGMHWGWKGGYVFMALEGHWQPDGAPRDSTGGFSYHFGGNENFLTIPLKSKLTVRPGSILLLNFDLAKVLSKLDISRDGDSTHSRQQDPIVRVVRQALPNAFTLSIEQARQSPLAKARPTKENAPVGRPYPFMVDAHMPTVSLPVDNPMTIEGVALGKLLFNDPRLSVDEGVSCASCHRKSAAFSDGGKAFSKGVAGHKSDRNAMPLFNLAWVENLFWDGRASRLKRQVLEPIQHPHEMAESLPRVVAKLSKDRKLVSHFNRVFGSPISAEQIGMALEQYLLSIVSQDSKFDRTKKGGAQFTPAEKRGLELFLTEHDPSKGLFGADCFHCHSGSLFTNHRFANNGLVLRAEDLGREGVTQDKADRAKFRTPSLRNIAVTGPYMHDGRFKTLEEVVEHYDRGMARSSTLDPNLAKHPKDGLRLSAQNKADLVAFLRTLTDQALLRGK